MSSAAPALSPSTTDTGSSALDPNDPLTWIYVVIIIAVVVCAACMVRRCLLHRYALDCADYAQQCFVHKVCAVDTLVCRRLSASRPVWFTAIGELADDLDHFADEVESTDSVAGATTATTATGDVLLGATSAPDRGYYHRVLYDSLRCASLKHEIAQITCDFFDGVLNELDIVKPFNGRDDTERLPDALLLPTPVTAPRIGVAGLAVCIWNSHQVELREQARLTMLMRLAETLSRSTETLRNMSRRKWVPRRIVQAAELIAADNAAAEATRREEDDERDGRGPGGARATIRDSAEGPGPQATASVRRSSVATSERHGGTDLSPPSAVGVAATAAVEMTPPRAVQRLPVNLNASPTTAAASQHGIAPHFAVPNYAVTVRLDTWEYFRLLQTTMWRVEGVHDRPYLKCIDEMQREERALSACSDQLWLSLVEAVGRNAQVDLAMRVLRRSDVVIQQSTVVVDSGDGGLGCGRRQWRHPADSGSAGADTTTQGSTWDAAMVNSLERASRRAVLSFRRRYVGDVSSPQPVLSAVPNSLAADGQQTATAVATGLAASSSTGTTAASPRTDRDVGTVAITAASQRSLLDEMFMPLRWVMHACAVQYRRARFSSRPRDATTVDNTRHDASAMCPCDCTPPAPFMPLQNMPTTEMAWRAQFAREIDERRFVEINRTWLDPLLRATADSLVHEQTEWAKMLYPASPTSLVAQTNRANEPRRATPPPAVFSPREGATNNGDDDAAAPAFDDPAPAFDDPAPELPPAANGHDLRAQGAAGELNVSPDAFAQAERNVAQFVDEVECQLDLSFGTVVRVVALAALRYACVGYDESIRCAADAPKPTADAAPSVCELLSRVERDCSAQTWASAAFEIDAVAKRICSFVAMCAAVADCCGITKVAFVPEHEEDGEDRTGDMRVGGGARRCGWQSAEARVRHAASLRTACTQLRALRHTCSVTETAAAERTAAPVAADSVVTAMLADLTTIDGCGPGRVEPPAAGAEVTSDDVLVQLASNDRAATSTETCRQLLSFFPEIGTLLKSVVYHCKVA